MKTIENQQNATSGIDKSSIQTSQNSYNDYELEKKKLIDHSNTNLQIKVPDSKTSAEITAKTLSSPNSFSEYELENQELTVCTNTNLQLNGLDSKTSAEINAESCDVINSVNDSKEMKYEHSSNVLNGNETKEQTFLERHLASVRPKVPSIQNFSHSVAAQHSLHNWRRICGFEVTGNILRSTFYPFRSKCQKPRFAQAKKSLNHLYSYFSVEILHCSEPSEICIGLARKDFPASSKLGHVLGSAGYYSDAGYIFCPRNEILEASEFSKGDVIGCGIIFPPNYRRYTDLSTDDSSDGMTDVVLSSLLNVNRKSMDFVQSVLGLNTNDDDNSSDDDDNLQNDEETNDYYNENYVESRTKVEVYFTYNMQIVGKFASYVPVGGFYPTIQVTSVNPFKLEFDFR